MFSWKKNPKEQQSVGRNAKQNSLDNMNFSDLLKDPVDSFGTEDGGDDMDPDLLVCLVSPLSQLVYPRHICKSSLLNK